MQGLFETLGVKYIGCKVLASALAMSKELSKEIAAKSKIPVLPWFSLNKNEKLDKKTILQNAKKLGYPIFVKPNSLGSSVGITKVKKESELLPAIKKAFEFEDYILVEKCLDNAREVFCAVIETAPGIFKASACGELIKSDSEFFDYETKYHNPHGCDMEIPAKLPKKLQIQLQEYTKKFFIALGGTGLSRVDFLISQDGKKAYFSEINTIPGLSKTSLFPNLLKEEGLSYSEQIDILIKTALNRG
jgi:D-alanine-D-alanine ligase